MTLALYGNVERAANQTNGIMNHAENELFVSFTFELQHAEGVKRYTVERSFKRADALRIRSVVSRFIEEGNERVVIADKTRLVDEQVKQLLGLEMKDFTRAVVLPQGKFAEFLSLKGSERRQMLQRLFHLERYGDELNKKLKNKIGRRVRKVRGDQRGASWAWRRFERTSRKAKASVDRKKRGARESEKRVARHSRTITKKKNNYGNGNAKKKK